MKTTLLTPSFWRRHVYGLTIGLLALTLLAPGASAAEAHAASKINFQQLYNRTLSDYTSLQYIASQHDSFAKHTGRCGIEWHKPWVSTARKDMHNAWGVVNVLKHAPSKARKTAIYHDLLMVTKRLTTWGHNQIMKHIGTCQKMPAANNAITKGLTTVSTDLGVSGGY